MADPSSHLPDFGVVALGNPLLGDDGAGPALASLLEGRVPWLRELGSDILSLSSHRPYPSRLLFVDAARGLGEPGSLHLWTRHTLPPLRASSSAHQLWALEGLLLLQRTDPAFAALEWSFLAIEVEGLELGAPLSTAVQRSLERLARLLTEEGYDGLVSGEIGLSYGLD